MMFLTRLKVWYNVKVVFSLKNFCVCLIVFCLVTLQAFQPFIHAHIDAKQTVHQSGFHIGGEHEEGVSVEHFDHHSVSNTSHTISVGSAIKKDIDTDLVAGSIVTIIIISFFFTQALKLLQRLNPAAPKALKESLKRQPPTTRAPPKS